jgi:hypothetical protein
LGFLETFTRFILLIFVCILFIGSLFAFLNSPQVEERPFPASGVWSSFKNAVFMVILIGIAIILLALIILQIDNISIFLPINDNFYLVSLFVSNILPIFFTWFGGLAWCQHWALRFVLWRNGNLPFRLVPWLDEMTERGLLRRVGGGYIFIHRSLLEYIGGLEEVTE